MTRAGGSGAPGRPKTLCFSLLGGARLFEEEVNDGWVGLVDSAKCLVKEKEKRAFKESDLPAGECGQCILQAIIGSQLFCDQTSLAPPMGWSWPYLALCNGTTSPGGSSATVITKQREATWWD